MITGYFQDKSKRILILGDGDFSFTAAFIINLLKNNMSSYEIITSEIRVKNPEDTKEAILNKIQSKFTYDVTQQFQLQVKEIDACNIQNMDNEKFDEIIFNFPTPMGYGQVKLSDLFSEIRNKKLLSKHGLVKIAYWQMLYDNRYEACYNLMPCAISQGFKIKEREIFDYLAFEKEGYAHTVHDGQISKFIEDNIPLMATFVDASQPNQKYPLDDSDYSGFTDDESIEKDAMIYRPAYSSVSSVRQNHLGKTISRIEYMKHKHEQNPKQYEAWELLSLARQQKWREIDKRLKVLVESRTINWFIDHYSGALYREIDTAYNNLDPALKPPQVIDQYCQFSLFTKLKVLAGVKIPELKARYNWN